MSMVERVAAAIRAAMVDVADVDILKWGSEKAARAAIEAMREPSEGMIHAGIAAIGNPDVGMAFVEMISAALSEQGE